VLKITLFSIFADISFYRS